MQSRHQQPRYRSGSSQIAGLVATFGAQMADYARAQHFRELREARHLSQEDAAHDIGVSVRAYREWENGGGIKWENAQRAAAFYEVPPESLVSRDPAEQAAEALAATWELPPGVKEQLDNIEAMLADLVALRNGNVPAPEGELERPSRSELPSEQSPSEHESRPAGTSRQGEASKRRRSP